MFERTPVKPKNTHNSTEMSRACLSALYVFSTHGNNTGMKRKTESNPIVLKNLPLYLALKTNLNLVYLFVCVVCREGGEGVV